MATDTAFAVGILALLGRHASMGAKLFLLSIAIVDHILAIGVIAISTPTESPCGGSPLRPPHC